MNALQGFSRGCMRSWSAIAQKRTGLFPAHLEVGLPLVLWGDIHRSYTSKPSSRNYMLGVGAWLQLPLGQLQSCINCSTRQSVSSCGRDTRRNIQYEFQKVSGISKNMQIEVAKVGLSNPFQSSHALPRRSSVVQRAMFPTSSIRRGCLYNCYILEHEDCLYTNLFYS